MSVLKQEYLPHYTVKDYLLWEGDWELIDGVPYAMSPAPAIVHQNISQNIAVQLGLKLEDCEHCHALLPVDWRISEDTVVQPDNLVVCGELEGQYLTRAPQIIFEILSPASAKKDRGAKFALYQQQGVRWYIIVDPDMQTVQLFELDKQQRYHNRLESRNGVFVFELEPCAFSFDFSRIW